MDSINLVKQCAAKKLSWFLTCWRLRHPVLSIIAEIHELRGEWDRHLKELAIAKDEKKTLLRFQELAQAGDAHKAEAERLMMELSTTKAKYLALLQGRKVKEGRLSGEAAQWMEQCHLHKAEAEDLRAKLKKLEGEHQISKDGNRALLRFIHTRHRLNMKFDPDSIRGALQRADQAK